MRIGSGLLGRRSKGLSVWVFSMVLLCVPQYLLAQGNADGAIQGTVTDPSGAGITDATVIVTNNATAISVTITTGSDGVFTAQNLPPSIYTVKISKTGFGTKVTNDVEVTVGRTSTLNLQLAVGNATETVNVEAAIAPVTDDRGDRGVDLGPATLAELPLEVSGGARQPDAFLTLAPGVTGNTFSARINGAPDFSQDFYYDGIPYMNADGGGRQEGLGAPFEAVDEYAIVTNAYNAQYGRGSGLLNFHIRSGTNRLHGSAWDYVRNNDLDSKGYFATVAPTEKQNEFGFKLGGPVYIPKVFDGKDKTFFFVNFNWFRFRGGVSNALETLPTAAEKTGDFSGLLTPNPVTVNGVNEINPCDGSTEYQGQIYDPATTQTVGGVECRTAFPGNIIPGTRLSGLSSQYLALMPTATSNAPTLNTLISVPTAPENNLVYLLKFDHNISSKVVFHASYYKGRFTSPTSPLISGPLGSGNNFNSLGWEPRASVDWTVNNHLLNQTLYSVQYTEGVRIYYPLVPTSFNSPIAAAGQPYPALNITGEPTYGSGNDNGQNSGGCWPCTYFADNVKYTRGRHNWSFGTELRWEDEKDAFAVNLGNYNFTPTGTSLPSSANPSELGFGFASFFLGTPTGGGTTAAITQTAPTPARLVKTGYRSLYAQDDIHVNSKLTVNLGLRWDVSLPAWNSAGYFSTFNPNVANPGAGGLLGSLVYAGQSGVDGCIGQGGSSLCQAKISNTYWKNFEPRTGFAYRLTNTTTVRGGFGITSIRGGASTLMGPEVAANFLAGYQAQQSLTSPDNGFSVPSALGSPAATWDVGVPAVGPPPAHTLSAANGQPVSLMRPQDGREGYVQEWNLTVEHQFPFRIGGEVSYVGSSSVNIGSELNNPNQVPAQYLALGDLLNQPYSSAATAAGVPLPYAGFTGSVAQALRPFPQFQQITNNTENEGHSHYNALQVRAQKYFSNGLTFLVSYTYSQTVTNAVDQFATFSSPPLNTGNLKAESRILGGEPDNDGLPVYPRFLTAAGTYELPIGPGKRYLSGNGVMGRVVGGWSTSVIASYYAGEYLPISGGSQQPLFNGPARPNLVPGVNPILHGPKNFNPATDLLLNQAAFSDPGQFALGDAPPILPNARGFPNYNENISILKNIRISEKAGSIQFRAEFFNAFNRVIFAEPDTNYNDRITGGFGKVTGQLNLPRQIQFALRYDF
jgi:Carboxypeptidase regulatory-like domain